MTDAFESWNRKVYAAMLAIGRARGRSGIAIDSYLPYSLGWPPDRTARALLKLNSKDYDTLHKMSVRGGGGIVMSHTQVKYKCLSCGLHFVVCTWRPDEHASGNTYCPECGTRGGHVVWTEDVDLPIFAVVPGDAHLAEMPGGKAGAA